MPNTEGAIVMASDRRESEPTRMGEVVDFFALIPTKAKETIERINAMSDDERAVVEAEKARKAREYFLDVEAPRLRKKYMAESGLVGDMLSCTFDSFEIRHDRQGRVLDVSRRFVKQLPSNKPGLAIWGPTGRGKSHLAKAIVQAAIAKPDPIHAYYLSCIGIGRQVRSEKDLVGRVLEYELLILDDLEKGLAGDTPEWGSAAIKEILEQADTNGAPKLVTTSESPAKTIYGPNNEALVLGHDAPKRLPPWLIGRLEKLFHWEQIDGPNGREERFWIDKDEGRPYWV